MMNEFSFLGEISLTQGVFKVLMLFIKTAQ